MAIAALINEDRGNRPGDDNDEDEDRREEKRVLEPVEAMTKQGTILSPAIY